MTPETYLTGAQHTAYLQYQEDKAVAWAKGLHYWQRIAASRHFVEPVDVPYVGAWHDPFEAAAPMKVTTPSGRCISELMKGGIHPPLEAHLGAKILLVAKSGKYDVVDQIDAPEWRQRHGEIVNEWIVDYRRCHAETAPPMGLEDAIEYVLMKDVPHYVWGTKRNRRMFAVMDRSRIPKDRRLRNAWKLEELPCQL